MDTNLEVIEAGPLLNALKKSFFKNLDDLLKGAAQYQKEMGVLKRVSTIHCKDAEGTLHEIIVKLSPIKDKEDIYYVEIESDGTMELKTDGFQGQALKIDKTTSKEFEKLIQQLLEKNGLTEIPEEEFEESSEDADERKDRSKDSEADDKTSYKKLGSIEFSCTMTNDDYPESTDLDVIITFDASVIDEDDHDYIISIKPSKVVPHPARRQIVEDLEAAASTLNKFLTDNEIQPSEEGKDDIAKFVDFLKEKSSLPEPEATKALQEVLASTIHVRLQSITGSTRLVKIAASDDLNDAIDLVNSLIAQGSFEDLLKNGNDFDIVELDDSYDISESDDDVIYDDYLENNEDLLEAYRDDTDSDEKEDLLADIYATITYLRTHVTDLRIEADLSELDLSLLSQDIMDVSYGIMLEVSKIYLDETDLLLQTVTIDYADEDPSILSRCRSCAESCYQYLSRLVEEFNYDDMLVSLADKLEQSCNAFFAEFLKAFQEN